MSTWYAKLVVAAVVVVVDVVVVVVARVNEADLIGTTQ